MSPFWILSFFGTVVLGCNVVVQRPNVQYAAFANTDYCYNFVPTSSNWFDASVTCDKHGGTLASIYDEHTHQFLIKTIRKHPRLVRWNFWIGIYQRRPREADQYQWTDTPLNCDAHPSLPRKECRRIPGVSLGREECLKKKCCYLEKNDPKCFYSPVNAPQLLYTRWSRNLRPTNQRRCGALSKDNNYQWMDNSCNYDIQHGFICQFYEPQVKKASGDLSIVWIILIVCLLAFILSLILCICTVCIIRKRRRRWKRNEATQQFVNGQNYKPYRA